MDPKAALTTRKKWMRSSTRFKSISTTVTAPGNSPRALPQAILHVISCFKVRLVLDTDVLLAALRSDRGASRELLLAALDRRVVALVSVPLFLEYESVLTRSEHRIKTGLSVEETNEVLYALAAVAERVSFHFLWRPQLNDPADEMVLGTAVNGRADRLATFNIRHLSQAASSFGIPAWRPGEILRELRSEEHAKK
jgi:putative PIN family toxin of toxin-antitoxin system